MIVYDFHVAGTTLRPGEADPVLLVDPDTVLTVPITREQFQPIPRRDSEFLNLLNGIELIQFSARNTPKPSGTGFSGFPGGPAIENGFRSFVLERLDHISMIARLSCYVNSSSGRFCKKSHYFSWISFQGEGQSGTAPDLYAGFRRRGKAE